MFLKPAPSSRAARVCKSLRSARRFSDSAPRIRAHLILRDTLPLLIRKSRGTAQTKHAELIALSNKLPPLTKWTTREDKFVGESLDAFQAFQGKRLSKGKDNDDATEVMLAEESIRKRRNGEYLVYGVQEPCAASISRTLLVLFPEWLHHWGLPTTPSMPGTKWTRALPWK